VNRNKLPLFLLLFCLLAGSLPVCAQAAGPVDRNRAADLTISYVNDKTALKGAVFHIYQVAEMDSLGKLTETEAFRDYPVDIRGENDEAWKTLATTLEGYVLRDAVTPDRSGETDKAGLLTLADMPHGLYLVLSEEHQQGGRIYETIPFFVLLPSRDRETDEWLYDVTVTPKLNSRPNGGGGGGGGSETLTRKVLKVWNDEGSEELRPEEITVQLLRDGKVFDTVTLTADNNWRHTWTELDAELDWTVVEKEPEGYTVEVTREGVTFVITNTPEDVELPEPPTPVGPGEPPPVELPDEPVPSGPKLPQTGQLWWPVPTLVSAGLLLILAGLLRRRGAADEA